MHVQHTLVRFTMYVHPPYRPSFVHARVQGSTIVARRSVAAGAAGVTATAVQPMAATAIAAASSTTLVCLRRCGVRCLRGCGVQNVSCVQLHALLPVSVSVCVRACVHARVYVCVSAFFSLCKCMCVCMCVFVCLCDTDPPIPRARSGDVTTVRIKGHPHPVDLDYQKPGKPRHKQQKAQCTLCKCRLAQGACCSFSRLCATGGQSVFMDMLAFKDRMALSGGRTLSPTHITVTLRGRVVWLSKLSLTHSLDSLTDTHIHTP